MASDMVTSVIMSDVLTPSQLKRLKEHKYSAAGQSVCEPALQVINNNKLTVFPVIIA